MTNDRVCLKFVTDQQQDLKRIDKLNNLFLTYMCGKRPGTPIRQTSPHKNLRAAARRRRRLSPVIDQRVVGRRRRQRSKTAGAMVGQLFTTTFACGFCIRDRAPHVVARGESLCEVARRRQSGWRASSAVALLTLLVFVRQQPVGC